MLNPTKFFISLMGLLLVLGVGIALAQETPTEVTEAVNLDENIQPQDLGISEPTLLPDSPFYFLKNWGRGIRSFFAFNPVVKAELESKFSNEKLMELKKMIEEKKDAKVIEKAVKNYQKGVEIIKERTEKIKEKAKENPKIESFLDKYTKHQILHQRILQKLETQVPPEVFEKIKEARERHLERFGEVMIKLEDKKEEISERLEKKMEEIKGSKYKNFKNLEILLGLEEKVPEEAKEVIKKAQENAFKRLKEDLEKMSPEDQERFKEYIDKISGDKEKHLEILENLKNELKEKSITVLSPNGGEQWVKGKTYNITWEFSGRVDTVKITLNNKIVSAFEETIIENYLNKGSFRWKIPSDLLLPQSGGYVIRITRCDYGPEIGMTVCGGAGDESDDYFSIVAQ